MGTASHASGDVRSGVPLESASVWRTRTCLGQRSFWCGPELCAASFWWKLFSLWKRIEFKVVEAPPGTKGDTATGGTKEVTLENGTKVNVPLFINEGDVVKIDTRSGDYIERVKA